MKVVIDTNILINSTQDEFSRARLIINEVIVGNLEAYGTDPILRENKLLLKKVIPNPKYKEFLEDYFASIHEVSVGFNREVVDMDPEDDKFVNAALSAEAEYIITEDDHLLQHDGYESIQILKPADFWFKYKGEEDGTQKMLNLMGINKLG